MGWWSWVWSPCATLSGARASAGLFEGGGKFQEGWTVASGKNRVSGKSGKAMKP